MQDNLFTIAKFNRLKVVFVEGCNTTKHIFFPPFVEVTTDKIDEDKR